MGGTGPLFHFKTQIQDVVVIKFGQGKVHNFFGRGIPLFMTSSQQHILYFYFLHPVCSLSGVLEIGGNSSLEYSLCSNIVSLNLHLNQKMCPWLQRESWPWDRRPRWLHRPRPNRSKKNRWVYRTSLEKNLRKNIFCSFFIWHGRAVWKAGKYPFLEFSSNQVWMDG
jgi:hypothetical protein